MIPTKKLYSRHHFLALDPSMHQVNLKEAETQLAKLIEEAAGGEEVIITRSDGTSFKHCAD